MDVGISNARRLVRTELNYVENQSAMDGIKEAGMKYYRFSATLDRRTSATCREHDGHVYPIGEYQPGSTAPPLHPNCRSTIAGSLYGPDKKKTGTRIARNDKGKTYYVPADMTYEEWYNKYIQPSMIPSGKGNWKTDDDDKIIVTQRIPALSHYRPSLKGTPNSVVEYTTMRGTQRNYASYDENGFIAVQIDYGNHGNSKQHPYGANGEHKHLWTWQDGKPKRSKPQDLSAKEQHVFRG